MAEPRLFLIVTSVPEKSGDHGPVVETAGEFGAHEPILTEIRDALRTTKPIWAGSAISTQAKGMRRS